LGDGILDLGERFRGGVCLAHATQALKPPPSSAATGSIKTG
jgi:hypothetical protein